MSSVDSRRRALIAAVLLPLTLVAAIAIVRRVDKTPGAPSMETTSGATDFDYDFRIPAGTEARIRSGEEVEIVPQELSVRVGESIRIVNEDEVNHVVGVFYVPAGKTLTQHFNSPGILEGECDVHPSGTFKLVVKP